MNELFRRIVKSPIVQDCDLLLITGDVTDRGALQSWQIFWEILDTAKIKERVRIVPGNHDVCCLGLRGIGHAKPSHIEKANQGLLLGSHPIKFPWAYNPDPRVVVFGLNSNNAGNFSLLSNARGQIDYFQLKSLAGLLYKYNGVPVKIIALHHSPNIPEICTAKKRGQRQFSRLERAGHQLSEAQRQTLNLLCVATRVRLVVHGHLHMWENRRVSGIKYVGAPASTEPNCGFANIVAYRISGKNNIVRCKLKQCSLLR